MKHPRQSPAFLTVRFVLALTALLLACAAAAESASPRDRPEHPLAKSARGLTELEGRALQQARPGKRSGRAVPVPGRAPARAESTADTYFIDIHRSFQTAQDWVYEEFTLGSRKTMVLRFASDYQADAAIFTGDQIGNFTNNQTFFQLGGLDNQIGTQFITLNPGTYFVGARNQVNAANTIRLELDYDISLPDYRRYDGKTEATSVGANGGWWYQSFSTESGVRFFIDGCNSGLEVFTMPAAEYENFRNGRQFQHYPDYGGEDNAYPGLWEMQLPPGQYYMVFRNNSAQAHALTYTWERWIPNQQNQPPAAPGNLRYEELTGTSVRLLWDDNAANEDGYVVQWRSETTDWRSFDPYTAGTVSTEVSNLTPGRRYWFRAYAYNQAGDSGFSNTLLVRLRDTATLPARPTGLRGIRQSDTEVRLEWNDNADSEDGFVVQWRAGAGSWNDFDSVGADSQFLNVSGLTPGAVYYFRVYAFNEAGESGYSNELRYSSGNPEPTLRAPSGLRATPLRRKRVRLNWNDNSDGEDGFTIEVRTGSSSWQRLHTTGPEARSATFRGFRAKTRYYFRVRAVQGSRHSGYSNTAAARTKRR